MGISFKSALIIGSAFLALGACQQNQAVSSSGSVAQAEISEEKFQKDREAILAMAGNYDVSFDFTETVSFHADYDLKEPKVSGAYEIVRVIEDTGEFISLQHILLVGPPNDLMVVKHWRQDWAYQPEEVLTFIGGNAWEKREVTKVDRHGAWSQTVYQVDDTPRYGAVGSWQFHNDIAEWVPPQEWRPLPRRDMTTRDDYHAIDAINRHTITPAGWVHEQDNSKLILSGDAPTALVREIGVNTYVKSADFDPQVGDDYWAATSEYWAEIRAEWARLADEGPFAITIKGETEDLYTPLLELAEAIVEGEKTTDEAVADAKLTIAEFTTTELGDLHSRLRKEGGLDQS